MARNIYGLAFRVLALGCPHCGYHQARRFDQRGGTPQCLNCGCSVPQK